MPTSVAKPARRENCLSDLLDFSRAQAARADAQTLARAVHHRVHPLQIGALHPLGLDVRMADLVADQPSLVANITRVRHDALPGGAPSSTSPRRLQVLK